MKNYKGSKRKKRNIKLGRRVAVSKLEYAEEYSAGNKLGVYVHVPFCASKCGYCDFYSVAYDKQRAAEYTNAVIEHMRESAARFKKYTVDTVYFGGGTPTVLPPELLAGLLKQIKNRFRLSRNAEITVEANPATINLRGLKKLRRAGFNRVSIGMQSANEETLTAIGREGEAKDAALLMRNARRAGFKNISADLMYGLPGEHARDFLHSLEFLLTFKPEHISLYGLKLAEGTPLFERRHTHSFPGEDAEWAMYERASEILTDAGYEHYEISNFALPDYRSKHNLRYWALEDYLSFGPSAHSFTDGRRYSYVADVDAYIQGIMNRDSVIDEIEDKPAFLAERHSEYIMLMLRTSDGVDPDLFYKIFSKSFDPYAEKLEKYIKSGHAEMAGGCYRLTLKGWFISNTILAELI